MKKRWIILISNLLSIILLSVCLCGCKGLFEKEMGKYDDPWKYKQQDGEFYYYVDKWRYKEDSAVILGLVDEEKEIEELVIPETLGGYPVKQIGGHYETFGYFQNYGIDATNIDRIVINHEMSLWNYGIKDFSGDLILLAKVRFLNGHILHSVKSVHINFDIGDRIDQIQNSLGLLSLGNAARAVIYKTNCGKLATFVTILVSDNMLAMPEPPQADGFTFGGWYVDEEYEQEWDFETDIVTENMTLYAKWN